MRLGKEGRKEGRKLRKRREKRERKKSWVVSCKWILGFGFWIYGFILVFGSGFGFGLMCDVRWGWG